MKESTRFFTPSFLNKIFHSCLWMGIFGIFVHDCAAADGYSYERRAIETYFKGSGNARSPMTELPLPNKALVANQALRIMIGEWTPNISVTPSPLASDAGVLAQRIREEFQRNAALLGASRDKHIVAFLGNTGVGKSTLVNLLAGKTLGVSEDKEDYVLANPQDTTAMAIGRGGHSETVYPKFIDVGNLRFFDLPGFNDTDGSERNLMNAAFIRKILLDAASVRLVFVAGQDQFTADRSASVRQLFDSIRQLFVVDQRNVNLVDDGVFVATKVTCTPQADITDFLSRGTDSRDKATLNQQLKLWSQRNQLGRMFHPLREAQNKGAREHILGLIQKAKSARIRGINVSVLYPPDTKAPLEKLFLRAFRGAFDLKLQELPQTLSDYDRSLSMYASDSFWATTFDGEVCQNEDAIKLLKEFCINSYYQALKTFERDNAERLQKHIQSLRQRRQERVGYIEKRTEARTREVSAFLVPPQARFGNGDVGRQLVKMEAAVTAQSEKTRAKEEAAHRARRLEDALTETKVAQMQAQVIASLQARLQVLESRETRTIQPSSSFFSVKAGRSIPPVARGHEAVYERFLRGVLIYRPNEGSDAGMVTLPIRELSKPLEGTFDLSRCGDTGTYLSISTGYRKGKKPENADKAEIWFSPQFLIEKELNGAASHFKPIMGNWKQDAPVGMFWTWGGWAADDHDMDYLVVEDADNLSKINLYENWKKAFYRGWSWGSRSAYLREWRWRYRAAHFHVLFMN